MFPDMIEWTHVVAAVGLVVGAARAETPRRSAMDAAAVARVVSAAPAPLIFLNGEKITEERMKQIPRENIASVEVLKGKAAVEAYGPDAAGGVILITTK
jgi:TonB-dependent SusC/RagA subfamily outer membrane receptor